MKKHWHQHQLGNCSRQKPHTPPLQQFQVQRHSLSRHGKTIPILEHICTGDRTSHNVIRCSTNIFIPDFLRTRSFFLFLCYLYFFNGDIRGIWGTTKPTGPAIWMTDSPWDQLSCSTTTTLSSVMTDILFRR